MAIDWTPFVEFVKKHQRFLITTHIRPDADGLGSMLGLAEVLERIGKEVQMVIGSTWPPRYDFLDPDKRIQRFRLPGAEFRQANAIVVLDTGTWNQLGDFGTFMKSLDVPKLVIDHHVSFDDLSATRLADTTSEATARLVYEAIQALRQPVPERAANNLFIGLAMDTGWFRHPNTTPATFALAEKLVQAGAKPTPLYEYMFEQSTLPRLKLTGLVLDRLQTTANGLVAHTEIRLADYAATGAVPQDTEDLVNFTRSLAGVDVGLFFMEQPAGGVKVSFRARTVDVAKVAEKFGGGGHRLASGAIIQDTLETAKSRVLEALREAMGKPASVEA